MKSGNRGAPLKIYSQSFVTISIQTSFFLMQCTQILDLFYKNPFKKTVLKLPENQIFVVLQKVSLGNYKNFISKG